MPRPKLHTDNAILDATRAVIKQKGPATFTLNDVANQVGISRAALIQRFENRDTLLRCAMERSVTATEEFLSLQAIEVGPQKLWVFLQKLCEILGGGEHFEVHLQIAWVEAQNPDLREIALKRNSLVESAIFARFPADYPQDAKASARMLQAMLSGATTQWLLNREGRLDIYVLRVLQRLLMLQFPREVFELPKSSF